jgi:transposase
MVGAEGALEIQVLHRPGKVVRAIARDAGLSRNTVRRYLRDEAASRYKRRMPRPMQVDWAVIRRGRKRLSVFVATLGWSRAAYVEFVTDERVEARENAFLAFGGVPYEVLYDNMRTVVIERHGYGRGRHRYHPGLLDFARHCGFRLRLYAPYRARTKRKAERFIRYLRQSFYVPLASRLAQEGLIVDRETANPAVKRWLR